MNLKLPYRKDYNKGNRCPGWSGAGMRWQLPWEKETNCKNGNSGWYKDECNPWHFHQCEECGIKTWPYVTRWIDPDWLWFSIGEAGRKITDTVGDKLYYATWLSDKQYDKILDKLYAIDKKLWQIF